MTLNFDILYDQPIIKVKRVYIMGMEITHKVCDIIAIAAPVFGSPPYAWGKTMVFIPKGEA